MSEIKEQDKIVESVVSSTEAPKTIKKEKPEIVKKYNATSKDELPKNIFEAKIHEQAVFDAIIAERASRRQGTHSTLRRGEVRGGGKKPFAQKHTGNARAGSTRGPIWVGGGVAHGPLPERNYVLKVNKKAKKLAFSSAFSDKAKSESIFVHEVSLAKPSTKELVRLLGEFNFPKDAKKVLLITENETVFKSAKNLPKVVANKLSGVTVEMLVHADVVILSKEHIKQLEGRFK